MQGVHHACHLSAGQAISDSDSMGSGYAIDLSFIVFLVLVLLS